MSITSTELRSFVTGLVLGDASITKGIESRGLIIVSINPDFIREIEYFFNENTNFKTRCMFRPARVGADGTRHKQYLELSVKSNKYFAKMYHQFYTDTRGRRISKKALEWLTPIGLANWFMSDGYIVKVGKTKGKIYNRRVEIATDRYPEADVDRVIKYFEDTYGYEMHKVKRREGVFRIRFSLISAQHFLCMIAPYVTHSMRYKLDMAYDYQPKWMTDEYYELMTSLNSAGNPVEPYRGMHFYRRSESDLV